VGAQLHHFFQAHAQEIHLTWNTEIGGITGEGTVIFKSDPRLDTEDDKSGHTFKAARAKPVRPKAVSRGILPETSSTNLNFTVIEIAQHLQHKTKG
jgi:hypothetical protein